MSIFQWKTCGRCLSSLCMQFEQLQKWKFYFNLCTQSIKCYSLVHHFVNTLLFWIRSCAIKEFIVRPSLFEFVNCFFPWNLLSSEIKKYVNVPRSWVFVSIRFFHHLQNRPCYSLQQSWWEFQLMGSKSF